jgi:integrase
MDRARGIRPRGNSIEIDFYYLGKRCRETLAIVPSKANLTFAKNLKASIKHEIAVGTFSYAKHFPRSKNAHLGAKTSNQTIAEALDAYLQAARRTCQLSTWRNYRSAVEYHLKPTFGDMRLTDLTASKVKAWVGGLDISNKRINNVLIPLRTIFNDAYSDGLIDRNPVDRIRNLAVHQDEPQPFTPEEIRAILPELPQQGRNLIQFAIWTGMRTSELIALEWDDIDWNKKVVRVRRAFVNGQIKPPKTRAGIRDVMLFPPALEALSDQKQFSYMAGKRIFLNPRTNTAWENDGQIRKTMWQYALKRAGVIYRNPYQTRHTYASTMLSLGENPAWIANQMGHADWGMIRKRYARWIPQIDSSAGEKVMKHLVTNWSQDISKALK